MIHKIFKNKKGGWLEEHAGEIVLVLIIAAVIIAIVVFKFLLPGSRPLVNKLTCGGISVTGVGTCRQSCLDGEQSFPNSFGCEKTPATNICCITLEQGQTIGSYGGDNNYNFQVTGIDINNPPAGCVKNPSGGFGYTCTNVASIKIKVVVGQGTKDMNIFANPAVSDNNAAMTYLSGNPVLVKAGTVGNPLTNDFALVTGHTYVFTAAAKCTDGPCTSSTSPNGIFRPNSAQVMTIVAK